MYLKLLFFICIYLELLGALHNALSDYCFETPVDPEYSSILAEEDKEWTELSISNIEDERVPSSSATSTGRKGSSSSSSSSKGASTSSGTSAVNDPKSNSKQFKLLRDALNKKVNILLW
jgi:hypothetical protein